MPKPNLSGAYGVVSAPPAAALANHPDRVVRYLRGMRLLWVARLAGLGALLYFLYLVHVI